VNLEMAVNAALRCLSPDSELANSALEYLLDTVQNGDSSSSVLTLLSLF
jgi:hypothetical protein